MTMVIFFKTSVESCGGGHGISSCEEGVCPSSPKKEKVMTMATILLPLVESREGGHGLCHHLLEKSGSGLLVLRRRG